MDGKSRYSNNTFVERQWRTPKYEEAHLKACPNVLEAHRGIEGYFRVYNDQRSHQALAYRTPAEASHGVQRVVEEKPNERKCSPGEGSEPLAVHRDSRLTLR